jgi:hypothetical protein
MLFKIKFRKKKKIVPPVDTFCRNCGVRNIGRYCHKCGQDTLADREQPIFLLVTQLFNKAFALDGRTLITLKNLMWHPGRLSIEYRVGKIVKYVHPVKLFWFATIIFFALIISQINLNTTTDEYGEEKSTEFSVGAKTGKPAAQISFGHKEDTMENENAPPNPYITIEQESAQEQMLSYFSKYGPFVTFLLIPVFALLLALFFWRNKLFYMYHLVFALHFHTFLWVFLSLLIIVNMIFPNVSFSDWVGFLLFLIPGVYLSISMRRFYQTMRWEAIWKTIFIGFVYFVLVLTVTTLLILLALRILGIL